jgi:K+:H+ antiporter
MVSKAMGLSWREASMLGVLLNTRGLVELVVLNIGLDLGILSPAVFSMLVLMALATTFMTSPLIRWLGARVQRVAAPGYLAAFNEPQ